MLLGAGDRLGEMGACSAWRGEGPGENFQFLKGLHESWRGTWDEGLA